ncbi:brachyurin-like isoform X2 [Cloeon dipterum]|uniref:brachyurin-like isoform X2 n=1 Tax=Cloeon dipterum TaxID=197152 RepID=UPI00321FD445
MRPTTCQLCQCGRAMKIILIALFVTLTVAVEGSIINTDLREVSPPSKVEIKRVRKTMPILNGTQHGDGQEGTVAIAARIVRGRKARRGDFPYLVGIVMDDVSFCGGSLISRSHVLTAAHCAVGFNTFSLVFGAEVRTKYERGTASRTSNSKAVHKNFNMDTMRNDIAIIYLNRPVEITEFISLVKLATKAQTARILKQGTSVTVAGWGKTSDKADISPVLRMTDLIIQKNSKCINSYGAASFTNAHICSQGTAGTATCQGDSGGPMMVTDEQQNVMVQVGLVSYGSARGCTSRDPEVFTRVASFDKWIAANCNNCQGQVSNFKNSLSKHSNRRMRKFDRG